MALYAMGDLHLSFGTDKPMDLFGAVWKNHPRKIEKYWRKLIKNEDTIVLTGDHSWGKKLSECMADFEFIEGLPGHKILLRGNHDMFWDAKKTERLDQEFEGRLFFLQNNFAVYGDYALVGSKGRCYEGKETRKHFLKIRERELDRLRTSFELARAEGYEKFLMFLHYPPTSIGEAWSPFTRMAEEYGAEQVIYSHCHGESRFYDSFHGEVNGVFYRLVSGDFLKFRPERIL